MTFSVTQKILFKHCDPAGIVFYPRYFEMINDAVEAYFTEVLHLPFEELHKTHGVPTVRISNEFRAASRHGDVLTITVEPVRLGGSSLDMTVSATCKKEVRFEAHLTLVYVTSAMRPVRWPEAARDILTAQIKPALKEVSNG